MHTTDGTDRCSGMMNMRTAAAAGAGAPRMRLFARRREMVAIAAIGAVATGSLAFGLGGCSSGGGGSAPGTTTVRNGEVWLQGNITSDGCDQSQENIPIGDVGCTITVNGYDVQVVHGNARLFTKPGTLTGLDTSTNQTGRHVSIYAQLTAPHTATILSAPKYYARIG
jgi:hypothetical protein